MNDVDDKIGSPELFNERGFLKRTCRLQKNDFEDQEELYSEVEEGEITDDPDSDLDYDPERKEKRKKKKAKLKELKEIKEKPAKKPRPKKRPEFKPPSFDEVMKTQITHLARFIEYEDEYESYGEASSEYEELAIPKPAPKKQRSPSPEPSPQRERKKRIFPWRPVGILGGDAGFEETYLTTRQPVNDVKTLIELENQY